ncbi:LOW QUALITY PROTEIN: hypothetical protein V1477_016595 [Vespula maculifrons]|uniref:Uncharacterized protein n=1 Tax=Vespula maculifrons TaxID=7453 RepID=A0ABD2B8Q7_VESMC
MTRKVLVTYNYISITKDYNIETQNDQSNVDRVNDREEDPAPFSLSNLFLATSKAQLSSKNAYKRLRLFIEGPRERAEKKARDEGAQERHSQLPNVRLASSKPARSYQGRRA